MSTVTSANHRVCISIRDDLFRQKYILSVDIYLIRNDQKFMKHSRNRKFSFASQASNDVVVRSEVLAGKCYQI